MPIANTFNHIVGEIRIEYRGLSGLGARARFVGRAGLRVWLRGQQERNLFVLSGLPLRGLLARAALRPREAAMKSKGRCAIIIPALEISGLPWRRIS